MRCAGLTTRGWTLVAAGIAWCVLAALIGQRDLWWPGLFLALLPLASLLLLIPGRGRVDVDRRVAPTRVQVGEAAEVRLTFDPRSPTLGGVARVRDLPPALGEATGTASRPAGPMEQTVTYEVRARWRGRHLLSQPNGIADRLGLADRTGLPRPDPTRHAGRGTADNLRDASGLGMATDAPCCAPAWAVPVSDRDYRQGDDVAGSLEVSAGQVR